MYHIIFVILSIIGIYGLFLLIKFKQLKSYHGISLILFVMQLLSVLGHYASKEYEIGLTLKTTSDSLYVIGQISSLIGFFSLYLIALILIYIPVFKNKLIRKSLENNKETKE